MDFMLSPESPLREGIRKKEKPPGSSFWMSGGFA
jgi:hypothetical protein